MIIIAGHIKTAPALVDELAAVLRSLIPATLKEDGCLSYAFALDDAAAGTVLVYERWRDEAALAAHLALPSIGALLGGWADKIELHVKKFDASNERSMSD
jgi:quinol monooxygenase YgiN